MTTIAEALDAAGRVVADAIGSLRPRVAIVLGSGLGRFADRVENPVRIGYADIPGFPLPTVAGHHGQLVAGTIGGTPIIVQSGRFHMYEGHSAAVAAMPVRVCARLGAEALIVTNAAGGIRRTFAGGTLMLISDHLNLTGRNPLEGPVLEGETRFPDMTVAYDAELRALARDAAKELRVELAEGVYAALLGPTYETPAEIRMLASLGADAVGMSTVPETIVARARGMRVLGISTITNPAAGISDAPLNHAEVMEAAGRIGDQLGALLATLVGRI